MKLKHKFDMTINGKEISLADKSHAGIFLQFWTYLLILI